MKLFHISLFTIIDNLTLPYLTLTLQLLLQPYCFNSVSGCFNPQNFIFLNL